MKIGIKPACGALTRFSHIRRVSLLLAATGVFGHFAQADTTESIWSGSTSTAWSTAGNWGANGVPSSTVSAEFIGTFTNQPTLGTAAGTAEGLWVTGASNTGVSGLTTIGGTGTLTVTGNATLDGIANAGILLDGAGNNSLTLSAPVALSNSTSFLVNNAGTLTLQTGALALGATTLTLGGTNASGNISMASVIAGTGAVVVNTSGTAKLSGANTFTGGLTLTAGTLKANTSADALGAGALNLNGGTLDLNSSGSSLNFSTVLGTTTVGGATTITSDKGAAGAGDTYTFGALSLGTNSLNVTGGSNVTSGTAGIVFGATTLSANTTFTVTNPTGAGTTELTVGVLNDGGAGYTVTKNGNGILYLSGTPSTDTGAITVNAGTLYITGTSAGTGAITVENGATLGRGDGGGSSYHPTNLLIVPDSATANFYGNANGGGLDMDGGSDFGNGSTINVVNTSTVPRGVSFSQVITLGDTADPTGNVNLSMSAVTSFGMSNQINGEVVDSAGTSNSLTVTSTTAGNFVEFSGSTVANGNADSTFKGGVILDNGVTVEINGSSTGSGAGATVTSGPIGTGTLTFEGNDTIGGTPTLANAVAVNGTNEFGTAPGTNLLNSTLTFNGPTTIANGAVLNSAPFLGTTTVSGTSATATITVGSVTGLAVGQYVSGTGIGTGAKITAINDSTLAVTLSVDNSGTVSGTGTFNNTDATTFGDTVALSGNVTVEPSANASVTFSGAVSDGGHGYGITAGNGSTTGTVTLSGANTFTGGVTINSGAVKLGSAGALNSATPNAVTFGSGSTGALELNGQSVTVAGLITNATVGTPVAENASTSALSTLTVANATGDTYAGVIEDGGSESLAFIKSGAGGLTLSGANTYTGVTTVTAGNLTVVGSTAAGSAVSVNGGSFTASGTVGGTVAVASGGTLNGTGTTGAVTVAGGGNINLQDDVIGTLTVGGLTTGNATTASSLSFDIQNIAGTTSVDSIADQGTLTLNGANGTTIVIGNVNGSTTSLADGTYDLLNYSGAYTGALSDLSLSTTSLDGDTLSLVQGSGQIDLQVSDQVTFPSDAGVYNVKNYGATGNGVTDDTAAFEAAIKAALNAGGTGPSSGRYSDIVILYVPTGTYVLSNTLHNWDGDTSFSGGWIAGMYIQGQSQSGTILKLQNSCPGYTSASTPKAVIQTGSENSSHTANEAVSAITYSGTTATATCTAHGYQTGQVVTISGATPTQYNGSFVVTVTGTNTFTYTMTSSPGANASGTIGSYVFNGQGDQAFRHYIRNLTIDVGTGNAGAVGIDYLSNNRGGIYNVTIKSSDSGLVGYTGLMMDRSYPGPGIVKNLTVTGFTTGISMRSADEYSMVLDNITLNNQLGDGMYIVGNTASISNLTSNNTVPVIDTTTTTAHVVVVNGSFTGGSSGNTAITGTGSVYARNITSTGYGTVIGSVAGGASPVNVPEYESTTTYKGFSSNINGSMQLPIEETPDFNDPNLSDWENGATAAAVTGGDYLASIQAAIDSGKPVVYLPQGNYAVSNTIHLRKNVQKFLGCCAYLSPLAGFPTGAPLIEYDGNSGSVPFTDIQNIRIDGSVEHNCAQDLVLENDDLSGGYSNTSSGTGALFTEDTTGSAMNIAYPQYVWARQLDIEGLTTTFFTNNGGVAWIFGFKTENSNTSGTIIENENNASTELLGGYFYITGTLSPTVPMIINNNSSLSANYMMDPYAYPLVFPENIQDIEGTTYNFSKTNCPLYSAAAATYTTSFVTTPTLGSTRSNFTGWVGYEFKVGSSPITVTDLGRWIVASTGGAHTVKLVTASTGADVPGGSVGVSTANAAAGAFTYATLPIPVTLAANTSYYLVSSETSGGDAWYDDGSTTLTTTSAASVTNAVITSGSIYTNNSTANHAYVPLNFKYY